MPAQVHAVLSLSGVTRLVEHGGNFLHKRALLRRGPPKPTFPYFSRFPLAGPFFEADGVLFTMVPQMVHLQGQSVAALVRTRTTC